MCLNELTFLYSAGYLLKYDSEDSFSSGSDIVEAPPAQSKSEDKSEDNGDDSKPVKSTTSEEDQKQKEQQIEVSVKEGEIKTESENKPGDMQNSLVIKHVHVHVYEC